MDKQVPNGVHDAAAVGFQRSAAAYERGRPDYPPDAVRWLAEQVMLQAGRTVVDLAAGTGKLTRMLVGTGATVVAVEPIQAMCSALTKIVPDVPVVAGTAERLPLRTGSTDVVTVAQAFHWFDGHAALAQIHRVLRPGGWLVLAWNRRELDDPVHQHISRLIDPYRGETPSHHREHWRTPLRDSGLFRASAETAFRNRQVMSLDGLIDRVTSTSFIAALPAIDLNRVVTALRVFANRHEGRVVLPYRTEIQVFARNDWPPAARPGRGGVQYTAG